MAGVDGSTQRNHGDPWVVVAGGFHDRGGMDKANAALARYLAESGTPLHLVAHDVAPEFQALPHVSVHAVPRPVSWDLIGEWLLSLEGRSVARAVRDSFPGATIVVSGGNCSWPDVNWVHSVHHAWPCVDRSAPPWFKAKNHLTKSRARRRETQALHAARLVIAHSERTRRDLIHHLGLDARQIRVVYPGSELNWGPVNPQDRATARAWLGKSVDRPIVVFVGALGHDQNKGFDTLWSAWRALCALVEWDADLVVAGGGRGLMSWRRQVHREGLSSRVTLLGFTERIRDVLAAADLLVSPVRYEAYGLNVYEAICRGVPAMVSGRAGIAERYPPTLTEMILPDPENVRDLTTRLLSWRSDVGAWRERFAPFSAYLRRRTWSDMARDFMEVVEDARLEPAAR